MSDSKEQPSINATDIKGIDCPACGHPTLMLFSSGYITCTLMECPNPDYSEAIQALIDTRVREELRKILEYSWTLKDDQLHDLEAFLIERRKQLTQAEDKEQT